MLSCRDDDSNNRRKLPPEFLMCIDPGSDLNLQHTRPLVGSFPIVDNHCTPLINVSVAILALSAVAALVPAALLGRTSPRAAI
jgi:hypothetical protein